VGTVVAPQYPAGPAPQSDGSDACTASSVHSVPLIQTAIADLNHCCDNPERYWGLLVALRNPDKILNQLKDRLCLSHAERWSYFTAWIVIFLSKKSQAALVRCHTEHMVEAFVAAKHTATFSPNHYISNKKVPPIAMLKEAARLYREGHVLNMQVGDAEVYQRKAGVGSRWG
jgi:hypothetical protein